MIHVYKKVSLWLIGIAMLISFPAVSQQQKIEIKGSIKDMNGNPLEAMVRTKGGGSRLSSGGNFTTFLDFLPDTILFTAGGYQNVMRIVKNSSFLNIVMTPDIRELEEVVINTGYQTLKPNEVNGTIALISKEDIQMRTAGTILDRIEGHASGLIRLQGKQESTSSTLLVRGLGTINGPLEPLIVLDGFIYDGDIENINPEDVENVSVLKDASASSIWGARAGNGVIVITTKKGKLGQKMQLSFSADQSIQTPPKFDEMYHVGAKTHIEIEKFLFEQGYFDQVIRSTPYRARTPVIEILLQQREGKLNQQEVDKRLDFYLNQDARQNYLDEFYTNAHRQQYNVSFSGGSTHYAYNLGVSHNQDLSYVRDKASRLNVRLNNMFRISDKVSLTVNAQLSNNKNRLGAPTFGSISAMGRAGDYLAFRDENGVPIPIDWEYRGSYTDSVGKDILLDWKRYPATDYQHIKSGGNSLDLFTTLNLSYRPISGLDLSASYQYQIQQGTTFVHSTLESYHARNLINQYTQVDPITGLVTYGVPVGGIYSSRQSGVNSFTWRGQANYKKQIQSHYFQLMLGNEWKGSGTTSQIDGIKYGFTEDPLSYSHPDLMKRYIHFLTGAQTALGASNSLNRTDYRFLSFYGNILYSYLDRYNLSGSVRKDGSNVFGANTNDRWKPLWSAGLGWNISNEDFYDSRIFSEVKLVATYGTSGNVDMTKTALPVAAYATQATTGHKFARVMSINNPELRWEQLSQLSLRLDLNTRLNRLKTSINFFKKDGSDLYGQSPYDFTTWGASATILQNVAKMKGYGVEADITSVNIKKRYFEWITSFNGSWNDNRTLEYYKNSAASDASLLLTEGKKINPIVGKPLYSIAAYKTAGLDNEGNPIGYFNNEKSSDYLKILTEGRDTGENIKFYGSTMPTYYGFFSNQVKYKDVNFSIGIRYQLGYFLKKEYLASGGIVSGKIHRDYFDRWQKSGDENFTDIPAFVYPANVNRDTFYGLSETHVIPGDQIRLDYIRLGYSVNTSQWKKVFHQLDLSMGMENGGLIWKKNKFGIDPNYPLGNNSKSIWSFNIRLQY